MRVLTFPVLCLVLAGCSGGGGGGGGGAGGGTEVEPNDDISVATDLGGAGTHELSGNTCKDEDSIDTFVVTAGSAGNVSLALDWNEDDPDDDLGVRFLDFDGFPVGTQADTPPAAISEPVSAPGEQMYVEVVCYGAFDPVPYSGTITVP